ncbi:hypothetical protein LOAG_02348 [Loa loa]|uniref:Uncharacterized protein n=1 Tax=Loa loa TaxID=7209 RepID=A0A1S0U7N9_LOALO|nr:hypothetical protein LOAG_02348 [Loa loa]EFO26131.1 hypothetical protein LOAG_02348 [Loa loa]
MLDDWTIRSMFSHQTANYAKLTTVKPALMALSILAQIIASTLIKGLLPTFTIHTLQSSTTTPTHHSPNQLVCFINNRNARPLSKEEVNKNLQRKYAPPCALNNLIFVISLAL